MTAFIDSWHDVRKRQGSAIVAGLDPAIFDIGQGDKGLPEGVDLQAWSLQFVDAVAPYVAAVKPNQAFFQGVGQTEVLKAIVERVHEHGLLAISDNKIADIGNTNNAWAYYNATIGFDALTAAPYAGTIESTITSIQEHGMGAITMGLMSNPEYKTEMQFIDPDTQESLWKSRIRRSLEAGADAIVVGGTYTTADPAFMECVEMTHESDILYLIPGIGAQGGTIEEFLASGIDRERCMVNSGRAIMFPNGSSSTPEEQAAAAASLQKAFTNA